MTPFAEATALARLMRDDSAFFARYQPVVDLTSGAVRGHASSLHGRTEHGELAPLDLFFSMPDDATTARLDRLGRTVAIRDAAGWLGPDLLFVRLLAEVLAEPTAALEGMTEAAKTAGVELSQVVVEVQLENGRYVLGQLARAVTRCRGVGMSVAVAYAEDAEDIRGTISMLAPDYIKLERSLVYADGVAVTTVVEAAHGIGAKVVAFGIETPGQAKAARDRGADWGQGWYLGRPTVPGG